MNILPELGKIAGAQYGLQMKDSLFAAFDKLVSDPKFGLVKTDIEDDYAEFDELLTRLYNDNTTSYVIRDFLELYLVLNGRKGFFSKVENPTEEQNICHWINMLVEELIHSANNDISKSLPFVGDGIVNGKRMRAAMYYILDILQSSNAMGVVSVTNRGVSPLYISGKDVMSVKVYGNADGVGTIIPDQGIKIRIKIKITDMHDDEASPAIISTTFNRLPLHEGESVTINLSGLEFNESVYKVEIMDFTTNIEASYTTQEVLYSGNEPIYICGRDIDTIKVYGNKTGVGTKVFGSDIYVAEIKITDLLSNNMSYKTVTVSLGEDKLYEDESVTVIVPENVQTPYSIYKVEVVDFATSLDLTFKLTKEPLYQATDEDFLYVTNEETEESKACYYLNNKKSIVLPSTLGGYPVTTIGISTFMKSDLSTAVIPEGVTTIE